MTNTQAEERKINDARTSLGFAKSSKNKGDILHHLRLCLSFYSSWGLSQDEVKKDLSNLIEEIEKSKGRMSSNLKLKVQKFSLILILR